MQQKGFQSASLFSPSTPLPQHYNFISFSWPLFKRQKLQVRQEHYSLIFIGTLDDADKEERSFDWSYWDKSHLFVLMI